MCPLESVIDIPSSFIAVAILSVGLARFAIAVFKDVPAWLPLIPALAISPKASAASSAEYPRAPKRGATYLKDSPSMATLVLLLELALAKRSAK